jgi:spore germination cell wall hydrolase CwlJ-like protein
LTTTTIKLTKAHTLSSILLKVSGLIVVVLAVTNVTVAKLDELRAENEAPRQGFISAADRTQQLTCLTRNIYYEAATEPFEGKVAVAQVTMNRVENGRFGRDVCGVVYQKNVVYEKVICQFSWTCNGVSAVKPIYSALWKESEEVAKKVLLENFRLPSMKNAIYYHADYVNPQWGKPQITKIGRHIFYSEGKKI